MELFRGETLVIPRSRDWKLIDATNEYSLHQRLACRIEPGESPLELWKKHPEWSLPTLERNVKTCTLYPFPVGMEVIRMFKPKRWLDPTAGWGDRLRVAIASDVEYVGVDSNRSMQPAYRAIIDDLAPGSKKFQVKEGKFQNARLSGKFDLVFTSPPFYTKEVYEDMKVWESVDDFVDDFLRPLFKKSVRHLEADGHIVLYIEDTGVDSFIPQLKEVASEFPLVYEGAFYYQGSKPRPYYVWKKKQAAGSKTRKRSFRSRK